MTLPKREAVIIFVALWLLFTYALSVYMPPAYCGGENVNRSMVTMPFGDAICYPKPHLENYNPIPFIFR